METAKDQKVAQRIQRRPDAVCLGSLGSIGLIGAPFFTVVGFLVVGGYLNSVGGGWALPALVFDAGVLFTVAVLSFVCAAFVLLWFFIPMAINSFNNYGFIGHSHCINRECYQCKKGISSPVVRHDLLVFVVASLTFVFLLYISERFSVKYVDVSYVYVLVAAVISVVDIYFKNKKEMINFEVIERNDLKDSAFSRFCVCAAASFFRWLTVLSILIPASFVLVFVSRNLPDTVGLAEGWMMLGVIFMVIFVLYAFSIDLASSFVAAGIFCGLFSISVNLGFQLIPVKKVFRVWGIGDRSVEVTCISNRCEKALDVIGEQPHLLLAIDGEFALANAQDMGRGVWLARDDVILQTVENGH